MIHISKLENDIDAEFNGVECSPNGQWIACTWGRRGKLAVMAANVFEQLAEVPSGEAKSVCRVCSCVKWSPNSKQIAHREYNGNGDIVIYNVERNARDITTNLILKGHRYGEGRVAWSANGMWLASAGVNDVDLFRVWGVATTSRKLIGKSGYILPYDQSKASLTTVVDVAWSPNALKLIGTCNKKFCMWEFLPKTSQFQPIVTRDSPNNQRILCVAWSTKNEIAMGCSECCYILNDAGIIAHLLSAQYTTCLAWSTDGEYLACGSRDNVQVWHNLQRVNTLNYPGATSVSFNNKQLLSTHAKIVRIWNFMPT